MKYDFLQDVEDGVRGHKFISTLRLYLFFWITFMGVTLILSHFWPELNLAIASPVIAAIYVTITLVLAYVNIRRRKSKI